MNIENALYKFIIIIIFLHSSKYEFSYSVYSFVEYWEAKTATQLVLLAINNIYC